MKDQIALKEMKVLGVWSTVAPKEARNVAGTRIFLKNFVPAFASEKPGFKSCTGAVILPPKKLAGWKVSTI